MAFLRDFESNGDWDREAAAQQTIIVRALYENRQDIVEAMLAPAAEIIKWEFRGGWLTPWPPSYCVIENAINDFFVVIAGTTSLRQAGGHIFGSVLVPFVTLTGFTSHMGTARPNYAWMKVAVDMWQEIRPVLPAVISTAHLHFFGHSYGGAVAAVTAEGVRREGALNVQCMTIGSPKVWTYGGLDFLPTVYYRLESEGDLVTASPPDTDLVASFSNLNEIKAAAKLTQLVAARWQHQGVGVLLTADGSGVPSAPATFPVPEFVTDSFLANHTTANYFGRIVESWKRQVG